MKKPKKTLKELKRIEDLLEKQTARTAKLLARRKSGDAENPVTVGYYDRMAAHQSAALADLSEITHLTETLSRQIVEKEEAQTASKAGKKAAKTIAKTTAPATPAARKQPAPKAAVKKTPAETPRKAAAKTSAPRPARRAATKAVTA